MPRQEGRPHPAAFPVEALIFGMRAREVAEALVADCEVRVSGRLDVAQWLSGDGRWGLQLLADDVAAQAIVLNDPPLLLPDPGPDDLRHLVCQPSRQRTMKAQLGG